MSVCLFLFRHGESIDNQNHVFSGWRDVELSEKGKVDASELAELLKDKTIEVFYSPPLKRNLSTVETIRQYHPEAEVLHDERLKERCYGELQGRTHLELMRQDLELYLKYHRAYDAPPPGGESIKMVEERVRPFYDKIRRKAKSETLGMAICAGNNAMRVLRRYLEGLTVEQMMKMENPYDNYFEYIV